MFIFTRTLVTHIDRYQNMGFRLLELRWNQAFWGVEEPLCKTVLWRVFEGPRTTNSKTFPNIAKQLITMFKWAKNSHQKRPELQGEKWWEALRGPWSTNKFQAQWLEHPAPEGQPQRKDWLNDGGVDGNYWFQVQCSMCSATLQCKKQNIESHALNGLEAQP